MAYIGLRKPIVFPYDAKTKKYTAGVAFGKAVDFSDTPNTASAELYGDDGLAESEKAVTSSALSLGTTDVPDNCKTVMFGHTASENEYTYNVDDEAPYIGFAVIGVKKVDGVRSFEAKAYPLTQWEEPTVTIQTRGESTSFTTPSTNGTALPNDDGDYKWEESFPTEAAALTWINGKFGING